MKEEYLQLDADLKGLFSENKLDELNELLHEQPGDVVNELSTHYWDIINKYFETERFDLLFGHLRFVAFTCYIIEYAYQAGLISENDFVARMQIYQTIYELKQQHSKDQNQ